MAKLSDAERARLVQMDAGARNIERISHGRTTSTGRRRRRTAPLAAQQRDEKSGRPAAAQEPSRG